MKITFHKEDLRKRVQVIERILSRSSNLEAYQAVYLRVQDNEDFSIIAFNGREAYRFGWSQERIDGDWSPGSAVIPGKEFVRVVLAAPGETIEIESERESLSTMIHSTGAHWTLEGFAGVTTAQWDKYEEFDVAPDGHSDKGLLMRALEVTRYAASKSEAMPSFQQLHVGEGRAVAANGRRWHQASLLGGPTVDLPEGSLDVILLALKAEASSAPVEVGTTLNGASTFTLGYMNLVVSKLNYAYPDIDALAIEEARLQTIEVRVMLDKMIMAIHAAGATAATGQLLLALAGGMLTVSSTSVRGGGGMAIPVTYTGERRKFRLDAEDLAQLLDRVGVDEDGSFVFTLREQDDGNPGWFYVSSDEGSMEAAIRPIAK